VIASTKKKEFLIAGLIFKNIYNSSKKMFYLPGKIGKVIISRIVLVVFPGFNLLVKLHRK